MKTRIITSILALVIFIPYVLIVDVTDGYSLVAMCQIIGTVAVIELLSMTRFLKSFYVSIPSIAISIAFPLIGKLDGENFFTWCGVVFFVFAFYMLSFAVFKHNHNIQDYATMYIMLFYVVISTSCILMLYHQNFGSYIYMLCFFCAWSSDTAAYFTGRAFGKHKLCPEISPKKTVEGAVGGVVFCVIFVLCYTFIISRILNVRMQVFNIIIAAILMSVVSMLGDLIASLAKRHYNIKDYGNLFPGHGGMLDRFDSVFATAPILFILYTVFDGFAFFA